MGVYLERQLTHEVYQKTLNAIDRKLKQQKGLAIAQKKLLSPASPTKKRKASPTSPTKKRKVAPSPKKGRKK